MAGYGWMPAAWLAPRRRPRWKWPERLIRWQRNRMPCDRGQNSAAGDSYAAVYSAEEWPGAFGANSACSRQAGTKTRRVLCCLLARAPFRIYSMKTQPSAEAMSSADLCGGRYPTARRSSTRVRSFGGFARRPRAERTRLGGINPVSRSDRHTPQRPGCGIGPGASRRSGE